MVTDPPEHNSQLTPIALGDYPCSFARWYWDVVNPESILVPAAFSDTYPAFLAQIILDELFSLSKTENHAQANGRIRVAL